MAEKPRFWRRTVFAKNLGFGVSFGYRNDTSNFNGFRVLAVLLHGTLVLIYIINDLIECCGAYSEVHVFADDAKFY